MDLEGVSHADLLPGSSLVLEEASYFGRKLKIAGSIRRIEVEEDRRYLHLKLHGTDSEDVLQVFSAEPDLLFKVHICPVDCDQMETGERVIHARKGRKEKTAGEAPWVRSLEGVRKTEVPPREMERLRARAEGLGHPDPGERMPAAEGEGRAPPEEKEAAKKKKKKKKTEEEKLALGYKPSRAGKKDHQAIYSGTAMDNQEKVRRRVMGKAQKFAAKKKARSSSTSSDDGSSESSKSNSPERMEVEGVFLEQSRPRGISERSSGDGKPPEHAEKPSDERWRRRPRPSSSSCGSSILPSSPVEEGDGSSGARVAEHLHRGRRSSPRQSGSWARRPLSKDQEPRSGSAWKQLERGPGSGNSHGGTSNGGGSRGVADGPARILPGVTSKVDGDEPARRKPRGEERRSERKEQVEERSRPRERRQEGRPREGERSKEGLSAAHGAEVRVGSSWRRQGLVQKAILVVFLSKGVCPWPVWGQVQDL